MLTSCGVVNPLENRSSCNQYCALNVNCATDVGRVFGQPLAQLGRLDRVANQSCQPSPVVSLLVGELSLPLQRRAEGIDSIDGPPGCVRCGCGAVVSGESFQILEVRTQRASVVR